MADSVPSNVPSTNSYFKPRPPASRLFERVLIPRAKGNIKRIQIFLGDLERALELDPVAGKALLGRARALAELSRARESRQSRTDDDDVGHVLGRWVVHQFLPVRLS